MRVRHLDLSPVSPERRSAEKSRRWALHPNLSSLRMDFPGSTSNSNPSMERRSTAQDSSIGSEELERLLKKLDTLKKGDVLILAGSIPASLPDSIYSDIMERLEEKEVMIVVDATKDLLVNVLKYHPFLIKPNNHELGDIFGVEIRERDQVAPYAKKLQEMGARNVLVSMAGKGAVLLAEDGSVYESPAPKGKLINAVGAGDSMVAGFTAGYMQKGSYEHAFKMGVSTGSASAFSENFATKEEVEAIYKTL